VSKLIVLFNLKGDADRVAYEEWARTTDLPIVRGLPSVDGFNVQVVAGLFGSDDPAPYEYVEIIDINSLEQFGADVSTETMGKVASEFQSFADNPTFMLTNNLEG
jgi:hypothetical protein